MAVPLIGELEGMDRGRYAGPVGWMDATGDGEWGIALRCGRFDQADPSRMRLFAGCGIVAGSDPEAEVAEAEAKLLPMRDALTGDLTGHRRVRHTWGRTSAASRSRWSRSARSRTWR